MPQNQLEQVIREKIANDGPIPFETFMAMALYHPQGGYYMSDAVRIGPAGDFYTAPHLHPMMGWLLAVQLDEMKRIMGAPAPFTIVEIGAGKGFLAEGILAHGLRALGWKRGWRYCIVERNPSAAAVQQQTLARYGDLVAWHTSLEQVAPCHGCVVSNELIDAFPVHLLEMDARGPREIYVGWRDDGFREMAGDLSTDDLAAYSARYRLPPLSGYRTEANLRARQYLADIDRLLGEGFVITIDYGYSAREYYSADRRGGTLQAYAGHRIETNPLAAVGHQDITAHVNFTALRDWGAEAGLQTIGYCSQGNFLASLGIERLVADKLQADPRFQSELPKIKGLLFGLGDSHQVLIQSKGRRTVSTLGGFALSNRVHRL